MRTGFGYDAHRLVEGRPLIIGGVNIPFDRGLLGHSDADVLLHAIADAVLGAAALGDIGTHYPDTDPECKDADSRRLLERVARNVAEAGYQVGNVDATVVLELPRLKPYFDEMRENVARCLNIGLGSVSVKATTNEGMGFIGRQEGCAAYAVCTIVSAAP
ncbi:MAG: 2-C-methyl-D-erythritol 2,4-cyclodiphosphate synthase [Rhodothermales bacterium]